MAPAGVSLACRDGGVWHFAVAALHGLAAAALLAWLLPPGFALAGLLPAAWVWRRERPAAPTLAWDGQRWRLDGLEGRPSVALDLGGWMLLAFDAGGRRRWLPVSPAADPRAWPRWRAALYSAASPVPERPADRWAS